MKPGRQRGAGGAAGGGALRTMPHRRGPAAWPRPPPRPLPPFRPRIGCAARGASQVSVTCGGRGGDWLRRSGAGRARRCQRGRGAPGAACGRWAAARHGRLRRAGAAAARRRSVSEPPIEGATGWRSEWRSAAPHHEAPGSDRARARPVLSRRPAGRRRRRAAPPRLRAAPRARQRQRRPRRERPRAHRAAPRPHGPARPRTAAAPGAAPGGSGGGGGGGGRGPHR